MFHPSCENTNLNSLRLVTCIDCSSWSSIHSTTCYATRKGVNKRPCCLHANSCWHKNPALCRPKGTIVFCPSEHGLINIVYGLPSAHMNCHKKKKGKTEQPHNWSHGPCSWGCPMRANGEFPVTWKKPHIFFPAVSSVHAGFIGLLLTNKYVRRRILLAVKLSSCSIPRIYYTFFLHFEGELFYIFQEMWMIARSYSLSILASSLPRCFRESCVTWRFSRSISSLARARWPESTAGNRINREKIYELRKIPLFV